MPASRQWVPWDGSRDNFKVEDRPRIGMKFEDYPPRPPRKPWLKKYEKYIDTEEGADQFRMENRPMPDNRTNLQLRLDRLEGEACRRKFKLFVQKAWHIVRPDHPLYWNWHLDVICNVLEEVTAGKHKRVIFNVPPGTMKSLLVSVFWPAWEWITYPSMSYITASYGLHLSMRDNKEFKELVTSEWYIRRFGYVHTFEGGTQVVKNSRKGWRFGTSVGGGGTGEHPKRVIIDDPTTAKQALSDAERKGANTWFDSTISTRGVVIDVVVIIIMQRLHEVDLVGHVTSKWEPGTFLHVVFPMRYVKNPPEGKRGPDPRDARTKEGELLWPEVLPESKVRQMEIDLQELASAQLQQDPTPPGGTLFKRSWFRFLPALPAGGITGRGWDIASGEDEGDWTRGVKMNVQPDGRVIICDVTGGQWSPGDVDANMLATAHIDGIKCRQREEKEPGSSGKAIIVARTKLLRGYDYAGQQIDSDKVNRSRPFRAQCEAGNVYLLEGDWNASYLLELEKFPFGAHDDQVDATSCIYNDLMADKPKGQIGTATWIR